VLLLAIGCASTGQAPPTVPAGSSDPAASSTSSVEAPRPTADEVKDRGADEQERRAGDATGSATATNETSACEEAPWLSGVAAERGSSPEELEVAVAATAERSWPNAELLAPVFTGYTRGRSPLSFSVTLPAERCYRLLGAPEPPGPVRLNMTIARDSQVRWSNADRSAESLAGIVESPGELTPRCYCTGQRDERVELTVRFSTTGRLPIVRPGQRSPETRQPVAVGVFSFPRQRPGS